MEDLPYIFTRAYLVDCKYRLGLAEEHLEATKGTLTDEAIAIKEAAIKAERKRINELDRRFVDLWPMLEEYCAIVDSEA